MTALAAPILSTVLALTACNFPGWPNATPPTPVHTPTSPALATLPESQASACVESMSVVSESGYLDATPAQAGASLTRTWHVLNSGTCTWSTRYSVVPAEGESFGAAPIPLSAAVAPGEEIDLHVQLIAPPAAGLYSGGWALRSPAGNLLGAGNRPLRVRVSVGATPAEPTALILSLVDQACGASWVAASPSRAGRLLPCPGYDRDVGGSITLDDAPRFANGPQDDEPALVLRPPHESGGLLSGTYPPYLVQAGDQFRVILGCAAGAPGCAARFQLNARVGDELFPIGEWLIGETDLPRNLVVDLTHLSGRMVQFVLGVDADGAGASDATVWLQPRIVH